MKCKWGIGRGCKEDAVLNGFCKDHYKDEKHFQRQTGLVRDHASHKSICIIQDCFDEVDSKTRYCLYHNGQITCKEKKCQAYIFAKNRCKEHYIKWKREVENPNNNTGGSLTCFYPGCDLPPYKDDFCKDHLREIKAEIIRKHKEKAKFDKQIQDELDHQEQLKKKQEEELKIEFPEQSPGKNRIDWAESNLYLPEDSSQPFRFLEFQKLFLIEAFSLNPDNKRIYDTALLTCARKNGKTTSIAAIALTELLGPWTKSLDMPVASVDKKSAGTLHMQARKMAKNSGFLTERIHAKEGIRSNDQEKVLKNCATEGRIVCLASDSVNTLSFIPGMLIMVDELGFQKTRQLYDSMDSSRAAHEPLMLIIGTRGPEHSVLNDILRKHKANPIENRLIHAYVTDDEDDPFDEYTWYKANPALGEGAEGILSIDFLRKQFNEAKNDEEKLHQLKLFQLNMQMETILVRPFVDAKIWARNNGEIIREGPCTAGLDLAQTNDLTSLSLYWSGTGGLHTKIYMPSLDNAEEILKKSEKDRIPYGKLPDDQLSIMGKHSLDYNLLVLDIANLHKEYNIEKLYIDPHRYAWFKECCENNSLREGIEIPHIQKVFQNYAGMSPCIAFFEKLLKDGLIKHDDEISLKSAISTARVSYDPMLNRRFEKSRSYGRIDPLISATMAVGGHQTPTKISKKQLAEWYKMQNARPKVTAA